MYRLRRDKKKDRNPNQDRSSRGRTNRPPTIRRGYPPRNVRLPAPPNLRQPPTPYPRQQDLRQPPPPYLRQQEVRQPPPPPQGNYHWGNTIPPQYRPEVRLLPTSNVYPERQLGDLVNILRKLLPKPQPPTFQPYMSYPPAQLSVPEIAILNKGLKFIPSQVYSNKHQSFDMQKLRQCLVSRLSKFRYDLPRNIFYNREITDSDVPNTVLSTINQIMNNMDRDLAKNAISNIHRDNLNKRQRSTLKALSKRTDIIIRKSDKGDTIVVETIERYIM